MVVETQEVAATPDDIIPETQYDDADVNRAAVVLPNPPSHIFSAATTEALPLQQHRQSALARAATDQVDDEETAPFLSSYIPSRPLAQFWRPIVQSALRLAGPGSVDRLFGQRGWLVCWWCICPGTSRSRFSPLRSGQRPLSHSDSFLPRPHCAAGYLLDSGAVAREGAGAATTPELERTTPVQVC